ncbi:MAG TPA: adventurous gliding motility lipoprotein CglB [Myxococcales bacterium]|jgi:hypothetical protein|nr:adventurous gliding motility lipoprotein CglB [Myxococcales bacterium]
MRSTEGVVALCAVAFTFTFAVGCQTYDMEPQDPYAIRSVQVHNPVTALKAKPDLMLMVDKSGSMNLPIDPLDSRCTSGCGTFASPCPSGCPTRWSELTGAMHGFLSRYGGVARMGLTPFPGPYNAANPQCEPGYVDVDVSGSNDVPSELQATASSIDSAIAALTPRDGTPTGSTLKILSTYTPLANPDRDDYVLLLTDGLPNCNLDNPYTYPDAGCRCTDPSTSVCSSSPKKLCLDQDATVEQIRGLAAAGVRIVVVGFGAETASGDGPAVLTAMGQAGGYTITCPGGTDAECAGGTCNLADQTCSNTYYQAKDGAALSEALARLAQTLDPTPCLHVLPLEPSDPSFISVRVDGQPVLRGTDTWAYLPPTATTKPQVQLLGSLCDQAKASTTLNPLDVVIVVLQTI